MATRKRLRQMRSACRAYRRRKAEQRKADDDRVCLVCGTPMRGMREDAMFCSTACRVNANRRLHRWRGGVKKETYQTPRMSNAELHRIARMVFGGK